MDTGHKQSTRVQNLVKKGLQEISEETNARIVPKDKKPQLNTFTIFYVSKFFFFNNGFIGKK